jgi:phage major head subunit gpT-like protein
MPAITPSFLWDLESNMRTITSREYERLLSKLWWNRICRLGPNSGAKRERVSWLLDTARIQQTNKGGNIEFEDIVAQTTEVEHTNAAAGLKVKKEQFEDIDGAGIDYASHWSRQMGAYAAYWPQKMLAKQVLANSLTYDGKTFFASDHPVNPFKPAAGTFSNVFTGSASGIYPGALPIDSPTVTVDQAVANIAKAIAYIASIKMPNGEDPRFLRLAEIIVPPALTARAQQITNAKYIAQMAGTAAGGSGDVEAMIRNFGLGEPIEAAELSSAFGGSDTTYYLAMEEITSNELGAFAYINREPFSVLYYGPQTDPQLARIREYQWTTEGRNSIMSGHPYLLFQVKAT